MSKTHSRVAAQIGQVGSRESSTKKNAAPPLNPNYHARPRVVVINEVGEVVYSCSKKRFAMAYCMGAGLKEDAIYRRIPASEFPD